MTSNFVQIEINGEFCDIDEQTAIGFNFQSFNPADPQNLFLSYSNTFTLPLSAKNKAIIKFADHVGYNSTEIYDKFSCSVFIAGYQLFHGLVFIDSVSERINVTVYDKLDFVEQLKNLPFAKPTKEITTIESMLVDHINANNTFATYGEIVQYLASGTNDLWLPYSLGGLAEKYAVKVSDKQGVRMTPNTRNLQNTDGLQQLAEASAGITDGYEDYKWKYTKDGQEYELQSFDDYKNVCLVQYFSRLGHFPTVRTSTPNPHPYFQAIKTGHLTAKLTTVLSLIVDYLGIESNIASLSVLGGLYVRVIDIAPYTAIKGDGTFDCYFAYLTKGGFSPETYDSDECMEATAWDLFKSIIQEFNLVVDRSYNIATGKQVYNFYEFNNIKSSDKKTFTLVEILDKSFRIDGIKQKSVIAYEGTGGADDSDISAGLLLECENRNIEEGSTSEVFFKIGRFLPSYYAIDNNGQLTNYFDVDLSDTEQFSKMVFLQPDTTQYANVAVWTLYENPKNYATPDAYTVYGYVNGQRVKMERNFVEFDVPLFVAQQPAVAYSGAYDQYQKMVRFPLVYKVKVVAELAEALQYKSYQHCEVEGLAGTYYIASMDGFNPSTDKYFTMTLYRLEREICEGEDMEYLLATETQGGAYVITEDNELNKFITKE